MAAADLENLFQALGDKTRLRLLNLLAEGEICVCYFVATLEEPQPKISRHLAYLRRMGLVSSRREGKWIHYRIGTPEDRPTRRLLQTVLEELRHDPEMQADIRTLRSACCATRLPTAIGDAPRPNFDSAR